MNKPQLNIDELYDTKQKNDLNKLDLYTKLLLKIHTKIYSVILSYRINLFELTSIKGRPALVI